MMNWQKVIDKLNCEVAQLGKRLSRKIVSEKSGKDFGFVVHGEQRIIDLQTMQVVTILAQALKNGLEAGPQPNPYPYQKPETHGMFE